MSAGSSISGREAAPRYLAAWFPYLPADRILRQYSRGAQDKPGEPLPLALVEKFKGVSRIAAVSRKARRTGLTPGLTLADARVRIPELWVEEMNLKADADLLEAMGKDCLRFTPIIAVDWPDGLTLDITGCAHLFGGEAELRKKLSGRLRRAGLHVRTVIAGAPDTARALARYGRIAIVPPGEDAAAVRGLPIAALGLENRDQLTIMRAGLKTIGALADRPAALFAARFGEQMTLKVARLQGRAASPLLPRQDRPMPWAQRRFAEPVARADDIEAALVCLAGEVCRILTDRREGLRMTEASFHRADGLVRRIRAGTGRPVRDPAALLRLLRERLDALADPLDPGFGFDLVRLDVIDTAPMDMQQPGLDSEAPENEEIDALTDRLSARLGEDRVLCFLPEDSHDPGRAARLAPVRTSAPVDAWRHPEPGEAPVRPLFIFIPPQSVTITLAEVPDGPPRAFRWRHAEYRIAGHEGPERIAPEWWREQPSQTRDYFRVEDSQGRRFWLFRTGEYGVGDIPPRWFLHGAFG